MSQDAGFLSLQKPPALLWWGVRTEEGRVGWGLALHNSHSHAQSPALCACWLPPPPTSPQGPTGLGSQWRGSSCQLPRKPQNNWAGPSAPRFVLISGRTPWPTADVLCENEYLFRNEISGSPTAWRLNSFNLLVQGVLRLSPGKAVMNEA